MRAPFSAMEPEARRRLVIWGFVAYLVASLGLLWVAGPMRAGGYDIIPFEKAGDAETVDRIVTAWGPDGVRAARLQTGLDYGYIVIYGVTAAAGCALGVAAARASNRRRLAGLGVLLGWGVVVACGLDMVENAALLAELSGRRGSLPALAKTCALVKFGLLIPAAAYALAGLVSTERARRRAG